MEKNKISIRWFVLTTIILLAAFSRLIPHLPNLSPIGALSLFGAAHFSKKWQVFIIPLMATWLSDLVINNAIYKQYYPEFTWFYQGFYWQYGSYILIALAGIFIFSKISPQRIVAGVITSSFIFFLISNYGVWMGSKLYPQNLTGLLACYTAGLPFFKSTLLGDLLYSTVLFGTYAFAQKQFSILRHDYA